MKKDDVDASVDNESNSQNKVYDVERFINVMKELFFSKIVLYECIFQENGSEQEPKCVPRKRRWGTALSTDTAPSFSISTDSLKVTSFYYTFHFHF